MSLAAKITAGVVAAAVAGLVALAVPACSSMEQAVPPTASKPPAAEASSPTTTDDGTTTSAGALVELPEWALETVPWLIYPDGFKCTGTEGCPNDYRAVFGEPGDVLPEHVEYYDPAVHDWVFPVDQ